MNNNKKNNVPKTPCLRCGKTLRAIGVERKNGRDFLSGSNYNHDWKKRQFHKKCWKEHNDELDWDRKLKEIELERLRKENQAYKLLCLSLDIENPAPSFNDYDKYQLGEESEEEEEEKEKKIHIVSFD